MRLFLAVAADAEVKASAAAVVARLRQAPGDYRWVDPRDMHVTLRFYGETPESELPKIESLMREVAAKMAPFEIGYGPLGVFDAWEDIRVVWVGVDAGAELLSQLADKLGRSEPRPYNPHLTLGRRRRAIDPTAFQCALRDEPPMRLQRPVNKLSLYASKPASFGHTYEILSEAELAG